MEIIIFIIAIIYICLLIVIALKFKEIARLKGYDDGSIFWWCLFFPIAGYLMVIAYPDRKQNLKLEDIEANLKKIIEKPFVISENSKAKNKEDELPEI